MSRCLPLLLAVALAAPRQDSPRTAARQEISNEARNRQERILRIARSVQPEFGADLLLRYAAMPGNTAAAREFVANAVQLGSFAVEQYPVSFGGGPLDSADGARVRGSVLKLDRLSLKLRAVETMLNLDPHAAREIFDQITLPPFPPLRCDTVLLYNFEDFYRIFRQVSERGYTGEEIAKELHLEPWRSHLQSLATVAQLRRVAIELTHFNISMEQRSRLADALAMSIAALPTDGQQFLDGVERLLAPFGPLLKKIDETARNNLLRALRSLGARHLNAEVCLLPGVPRSRGIVATQGMERVVKTINPLIRAHATDPSITSLVVEGYVPKIAEKSPENSVFGTSAESASLIREAQTLKAAADKESSEWREWFRALTRRISEWKGEQEPSRLVFYSEKSILLSGLLNIPSGNVTGGTRLRDPAAYYKSQPSIVRTLREPLDALLELAAREDSVRQKYPGVWLYPILDLFEVITKYRPAEKELVRAALARQNSNIVLSAYFDLLMEN